jgi:hypothetical protein
MSKKLFQSKGGAKECVSEARRSEKRKGSVRKEERLDVTWFSVGKSECRTPSKSRVEGTDSLKLYLVELSFK